MAIRSGLFTLIMLLAGGSRADQELVEFVNLHSREVLRVPPGRIPAPAALNRFFSCRTDHRYTLMDPRLVVVAMGLAQSFGASRVEIVSAFRTSRLNEAMRAEGKQVALRSRHVHGQALDVRVPGVETATLCEHMRSLKLGGVGCYLRLHFVHIDVGPVRTWNG